MDANIFAEKLVSDKEFLSHQHYIWKNDFAYFETKITAVLNLLIWNV